jgi:hypothetical protein
MWDKAATPAGTEPLSVVREAIDPLSGSNGGGIGLQFTQVDYISRSVSLRKK